MNASRRKVLPIHVNWAMLACAIYVAVLMSTATAWAQSKPASSLAKVSPTQTVAQPHAPAATPAPKGVSTGIKVHGHWTIEVRNPDGSLVRRVEFENSIVAAPGFSLPEPPFGGSGTMAVRGGAEFISYELTGSAPGAAGGSWAILLSGVGLASLTTPNTSTSPCDFQLNLPVSTSPMDACFVVQAPTNTVQSNTVQLGSFCPAGESVGLSCNLTASPIGTSPNESGFQLSGSIVAARQGQVSTVATLNTIGSAQPVYALTSSSNFPGAPIQVAAGQTIQVTVNITFQ